MGNVLTEISLYHYLALSGLLFVIGLIVIMTRRNAIGVLMGLELVLNAAGINFVAFNKYTAPERLDGQIFVIFVIILAAAEAATALALVLNVFHRMKSINVDDARAMKG